ncbi:lysozyme inhibitor LprI family protein [Pantoea sp. CCBC3-3-1]|uniref:lysozyme inhibitor LprI family protein n=1 Tax=Pantoea sp. CCBC3-3-1 TaxID=2490851 RepID=UPI0011BD7A16|nr:hypothetical protein [Pantoea sp. CCBC3-3-1]
MMKLALNVFLLVAFFGCTSSALAIDCARSASIVENTICDSPQLSWLDAVLNDTYRNVMKLSEPASVNQEMQQWQASRDACASSSCLRWAYLQGIGQLYNVPEKFNWDGEWWNRSAVHGDGGKIILSHTTKWAFNFDAQVWRGTYKSNLRGDVKMFYGTGLADNIAWGAGCTVLFIPRTDGQIDVRSDSNGSCKLLMRGGMSIDGTYVRSQSDPRPAATLLSLGVFPTKALDDRFRQLAGKDYQQFVDVANNLVYSADLDSMGATVVTLSVKGAASRRAAIIMFTQDGTMWAMRLLPDRDNGNAPETQLITSEKGTTLPKTLAEWRSLFDY